MINTSVKMYLSCNRKMKVYSYGQFHKGCTDNDYQGRSLTYDQDYLLYFKQKCGLNVSLYIRTDQGLIDVSIL